MSMWKLDSSTLKDTGDLRWHGLAPDGVEMWAVDEIPNDAEMAEGIVADAVRVISPFGFAFKRVE